MCTVCGGNTVILQNNMANATVMQAISIYDSRSDTYTLQIEPLPQQNMLNGLNFGVGPSKPYSMVMSTMVAYMIGYMYST